MSSVEQVSVEIAIVLGRAQIPIAQLLKMGRGAVIALDAHQHDEVWVLANNRPIARGEILIQGERIAVSITETLRLVA